MPSTLTSFVRGAALALVCIGPLALVQAQPAARPPAADAQQPLGDPRQNQTIQHIHVEDNGAKVDEVRYGGQTQSISVQPKANVPGYEILPNDGTRQRQGQADTSPAANGPRVWNVMKF